MTVNQGYC